VTNWNSNRADARYDPYTHVTAPSYHYTPNIGGPRDPYTRASGRLGETPAVFVVDVTGETLMSTLFGHREVGWHAAPGTPCTILGTWQDGSVHLRWRAIGGSYVVDGRFPEWVVRPEGMERVGAVLRANDPGPARRSPWRTLKRLVGLSG